MSASRKKAVVRKFSREWVAGYVAAEGFCHENQMELLDLSGKVLLVPVAEIKWLCFVRDFNSGELDNPERLLRKSFAGRPRVDGVFLRLQLTDGDQIEGVAANDRSLISGEGIFLLPPDTRSNTQRMWIPTAAIAESEVVSVIHSATRRKEAVAGTADVTEDQRNVDAQPELFA